MGRRFRQDDPHRSGNPRDERRYDISNGDRKNSDPFDKKPVIQPPDVFNPISGTWISALTGLGKDLNHITQPIFDQW